MLKFSSFSEPDQPENMFSFKTFASPRFLKAAGKKENFLQLKNCKPNSMTQVLIFHI